ncbi:MAG TPA: phosphoribosylformylglycinamidine cyclo-ligase [Gemmatimonadales bacterium]|nr:phosphoribosylformylglycinamidine cyclo-ligase [Gemmatimonadales bacterium]
MPGLSERDAGVGSVSEGLGALLRWVRPTFEYAGGARPTLDIGYFANVIPVAPHLGIAISTDGVGTKLLVAQAVGRFDTVGIDCVAMNVNDVLCVGARPVALVDYIALEQATPDLLDQLGRGLARGCELAGVSCPGGELAQVREMLRGARPGSAVDLVGTAIGTVALDRVVAGQDIAAGDVLIGLESTGLHSNGFTLARRAIERAGLALDAHVADLGCTLAEELLRPTRIYVKPVLEILDAGLPVHALAHVTGDGLFNLVRTVRAVGFDIERWPEPPPIFALIQRLGAIAIEEMHRAFNMGIGFALVVAPSGAAEVRARLERAGEHVHVLGHATDDADRTIHLRPRGLVGRGGRFTRA